MASIARKASVLKPRYRAYSERKYNELDHTLEVLTAIRARIEAEGHFAAALIVTGAMCDVQINQCKMLGFTAKGTGAAS